jgi:coenzyme F420-dependent glucose-6-phosphate dehydrogenase
MPTLGYALSSEEHGPLDLVRNAVRAEQAGFVYALISDHFHPWTDRQGQSAFVWGVIGAIAHATERIRLGTGVTCPTIRTHPAIVAHASATAAVMLEGRFFLGVGSGENLNEHILGDRWPPTRDRLDMLEEAVEIIRELWTGKLVSHRGRHYEVANARLYTAPDEPPDVFVAAGGEASAEVAGRIGDGLILASPSEDAARKFAESGGEEKPRLGQCHVCWAESEGEAKKTALEWFPNVALAGELTQELPQPAHFEQAAEMLSEDDMAEIVACGPDPERHVEMIQRFVEAGCDHVYLHQIGPDQDGFFDFYEGEILPRFT